MHFYFSVAITGKLKALTELVIISNGDFQEGVALESLAFINKARLS